MNTGKRKKFLALALSMMMIFAASAMAFGDVSINETNFPDSNFRSYVSSNFDTDSNGTLSDSEIASITYIDVRYYTSYRGSISSLTGIENFTALTTLYCEGNQLTALDVSNNTALTSLYCGTNQLTALDVSKNTALTTLYCQENRLAELDLSNCSNLTHAIVYDQAIELGEPESTSDSEYPYRVYLSSLGVTDPLTFPSHLSDLIASDENGNTLSIGLAMSGANTSWNFSGKPKTITYNYNTQRPNATTYVDVTITLSGDDSPTDPVTDDIPITSAYFPDANFLSYVSANFDTDGNGYLSSTERNAVTVVYVHSSGITSLKGIEYFSNITDLDCAANSLTELDVSSLTALVDLSCGGNQLTELDVTKNTNLQFLECNSNPLTELDVTKNTNLYALHCIYNQLTALDVTNNTRLQGLYCGDNQLTALDVTKNTNLLDLLCGGNQLTALDVANNTSLYALSCRDNQITALDVSKNSNLRSLSCGSNPLTALDLSQNKLTFLNVDNATSLQTLNCAGNQLTTLDLNTNTALQNLSCASQTVTLNLLKEVSNSSTYTHSLSIGDCMDQLGYIIMPAYSEVVSQMDNVSVKDSNGADVSFYYDPSTETVYFASKPATIRYNYDVQYNADSSVRMDVTVALSTSSAASDLMLSVNTTLATVAVNATDTSITITPHYQQGTVSYSSSATWVTVSDSGVVTINPTDASLAGQHTVTITATDNPHTSGSATATITLTITVTSGGGSGLALNDTNFTDSIFRSFIGENFDTNGDGYLSSEEVSSVTSINVRGRGISSLTGIRNFTNLTYLDCSNNNLYELDVTELTRLETLLCQGNQLSTLDVTRNLDLQYLNCGQELTGNNIAALDVSRNTELIRLYCEHNLLRSLNVSQNTNLQELQCGWNNITALDVSNNTALYTLHATVNELSELDVTKNTNMMFLYFEDNNISEIDVTQNSQLHLLECSGNPLSEVDVTKNPELQHLSCVSIGLTSLNVTQNPALESLWCSDNNLTELDVSNNPYLLGLLCESNRLEKLDVSNNPDLVILNCSHNNIPSLDLSANTDLDNETILAVMSSEGSIYDYVYRDSRYRVSEYGYQDFNVPEAELSDNAQYPYQFDMNTLAIDLSKTQGYAALDNNENSIACSFDASSGIMHFEAKPNMMMYYYDAQYSGYNKNNTPVMGVNLLFGLTFYTEPSSVTFSSPSASAQTVNLSANLDNVSYTASVNPSTGLTASVSGNTLTLTPSAAGSYTVTITGTNGTYTETRDISVTVNSASIDTGITGISITSPAGRSITLPSTGGEFSATVTASGTPNGTINWSVSHDEGITAEISGTGSSIAINGTAPENDDEDSITYSVIVSAHDDSGVNFSAGFSVVVTANSNPAVFDMPSSVMIGILSTFSGITEADLHFFSESELNYNWEINSNDLNSIDGMNEQITVKLPRMMPTNSGVYVLKYTLNDASAGVKLKFYGITDSNGGNLSSAALDRNIEYVFIDSDGNEVDTVPEDKVVYVAMKLNAGTNRGGVITVPKELKIGTIEPVEPEELGVTVIEKIADTMSLDVEEIKFIDEEDITPPEEPNENLKQEASRRSLQFVGKLDTITVKEDGYYVVRVTLSDELYEQLKNVRISDLRAYALDNSGDDTDASMRASVLPIYGFLNTWELFTLTGNELEFTAQTFLMVGLLQAAEPLTIYLLKILMLLLGGCDAGLGFGLGGIALLAVGSMISFKIFRKK